MLQQQFFSQPQKKKAHTQTLLSLKALKQSNKIIHPLSAQIKYADFLNFDVFFSYPWGNEINNWPTQQRVKKSAKIYREFGLKAIAWKYGSTVTNDNWQTNWNVAGHGNGKTDGIDSSALFVCFKTKNYYDQVNLGDTRDYMCPMRLELM